MRTNHTQDAALKNLARKTNTPSEKVSEAYQKEVASLESGAKVKTFIPVLALRRVRQRIGRRK